jgi:hypothetical protein
MRKYGPSSQTKHLHNLRTGIGKTTYALNRIVEESQVLKQYLLLCVS